MEKYTKTTLPPDLYHAHHGAFAEDLPFWEGLVQQAEGSILALGCGTGRVALPLAAAGARVVGVDLDPAMLAFLRTRANDLPLHLIHADFHHLPLPRRHFALAILPCNTFTTIPLNRREVFLRGVARVLRPRGVFAFSAPNPVSIATLPPHAEPEIEAVFRDAAGLPVQVSTGWERTETLWRVVWHYDRLHPDGRVERLTVSQSHHLAPPETTRAHLRAAGFRIEGEYGNFDRSPLTPNAPYWVVVARR